VLLLPKGITTYLTPPELKAVLTHELCHVRRRDNLAAAVHMVVEALFWFHPLVWWIGSRLLQERERACDEEVMLTGVRREVYGEAIVKVCELYLVGRLPCVAGVARGDLTQRIEEIMNERLVERLTFTKKAILGSAGTVAIVIPIVVGMMNSTAVRAQSTQVKFEVASVRVAPPLRNGGAIGRHGGPGTDQPTRVIIYSTTLIQLVMDAYDLPVDRVKPPANFSGGQHTGERFEVSRDHGGRDQRGAIPEDATEPPSGEIWPEDSLRNEAIKRVRAYCASARSQAG
jgi:hypothetical protein